MHLGKRAFKVPDQLGEAPLYRALPRDQNIIIAFHSMGRPRQAHRFLQPPPRPVAHDRPAQALRRGEAEAGEMTILGLAAIAPARLEHERRRREASPTPHMQELRACLETSDRGHR